MTAPIESLFVTLRRSMAGTRDQHVRILRSLGFSYRQQTLELQNNASVRGAVDKVKHMLSVETDEQRRWRNAARVAALQTRPPVRVLHGSI